MAVTFLGALRKDPRSGGSIHLVSDFPAVVVSHCVRKLFSVRDVSFFTTANMNGRELIFYKERDNRSSIFKVLEPVSQMSSWENPSYSQR
jgi:hypothetical protein